MRVAEVGDGRDLPSRADRGRTLEALIGEYLHHLEHHEGRKHSTLVRYRGLADSWILPTLGDHRADRLIPRDFEAVLGPMRAKGLSQSSIHQTFTLLNGTSEWARRNRYLIHNPMTDTEEPCSTAVPHEVSASGHRGPSPAARDRLRRRARLLSPVPPRGGRRHAPG